MGSSSSKQATSSRSSNRKSRRVFQSACLGSHFGSHDDSDSEDHREVAGRKVSCAVQNKAESSDIKIAYGQEANNEKSDELPCISSDVHLNQWGPDNISDIDTGTNTSSAQVSSERPRNSSNRFLSRFNLFPGNISFRLHRATSLGSSRSFPVSSPSIRILNDEEELHSHSTRSRGLVDGSEVQLDTQIRSPGHAVVRDNNTPRMGVDIDSHPPSIHSSMEAVETRHSGWIGAREHNERNFRFSRTLSVGRLRDRVLRRSTLSDLAFSPLQQEREVRDAVQGSGRHIWDGDIGVQTPEVNAVTSSSSPGYAAFGVPSPLFGTQDNEMETAQQTESRYHDLMEHRSDFLERRRRIRSQLRALQRLGSRFENLTGHERSCIMSGQHRTGRCTCHIRTRDTNLNSDTNTRASISRIVMLAEALFEVLDEIHQQSVVLSSRPSISSIGSVPAPNEVVESLPVKLYSKSQKHQPEDTAQCYICLLDYEEGDSVRTLPCQHEFHGACIDKWLKEVHRVCPLCRGDVCRSNSLPLEI